MEPTIAYLARGRLILKRPGDPPQEIESAFARQAMERQARDESLHGWKGRSGIWGNMGMEPPSWGQWQEPEPRRAFHFRSVARGDGPGELFYVLDMGPVGGLFQYDAAQDQERRLMHKNDFAARDLARHPQSGSVALASKRGDGTSGIVVGENDGRFLREVTRGDCVDESPHWVAGEGRRIVYQSAPVGRDENGFALGLGPYAIELVDLDSQQITTLVEDEDADLLAPQMLQDGTLYYIRRPYKSPAERNRPNPWLLLQDIVFFPFRVLRSFVYFLNFFSVMFSGKPLMTASGPQPLRPEQRYLMLWGQMIDTKAAMQKAGRNGPADLVPKDWELIRRGPDGSETVLAANVLAFDIGPQQEIVYTNGSAVLALDAAGQTASLCTDALIERVIIVS